jgi:integrase
MHGLLSLGKTFNRKDRYVMLSPRLLEIPRLYWHDAHPRDWLFPGDIPRQPITRSAVALACRVARQRSGIQKPITPHSLRHYLTFLIMSCNRSRSLLFWVNA